MAENYKKKQTNVPIIFTKNHKKTNEWHSKKKHHERNLCQFPKPESYFASDSGSFCYSWSDSSHTQFIS